MAKTKDKTTEDVWQEAFDAGFSAAAAARTHAMVEMCREARKGWQVWTDKKPQSPTTQELTDALRSAWGMGDG